jgi:hypothetical protein
MTVDELLSRLACLKANCRTAGEWKVTVAKYDDRQLSAYTTVPVSSCRSGFDWTANQLIIEPAVKLVTKKEN